jgi:hypothetical protein
MHDRCKLTNAGYQKIFNFETQGKRPKKKRRSITDEEERERELRPPEPKSL